MKEADTTRGEVVIAGFGSPHGDDRAGWQLIERMRDRGDVRVRLAAIREATELLDMLDDCRMLIVVDACCSGGQVGTVTQLKWPDPRIELHHSHSTHGLGVCGVLRLAERLGRLPRETYVYGIEIADWAPGHEMTCEVLKAVAALEGMISADLGRAASYAWSA